MCVTMLTAVALQLDLHQSVCWLQALQQGTLDAAITSLQGRQQLLLDTLRLTPGRSLPCTASRAIMILACPQKPSSLHPPKCTPSMIAECPVAGKWHTCRAAGDPAWRQWPRYKPHRCCSVMIMYRYRLHAIEQTHVATVFLAVCSVMVRDSGAECIVTRTTPELSNATGLADISDEMEDLDLLLLCQLPCDVVQVLAGSFQAAICATATQ
jgi:hypothetical protein